MPRPLRILLVVIVIAAVVVVCFEIVFPWIEQNLIDDPTLGTESGELIGHRA